MSEGEAPNLNISDQIKNSGENPHRKPLSELYTQADFAEAEKVDPEAAWKGWTSQKDNEGNVIKTNPETGDQFKIQGEIDQPGYRVTRLK